MKLQMQQEQLKQMATLDSKKMNQSQIFSPITADRKRSHTLMQKSFPKNMFKNLILRRIDIFPLKSFRKILKERKKNEIKELQEREMQKISEKFKKIQSEFKKRNTIIKIYQTRSKGEEMN